VILAALLIPLAAQAQTGSISGTVTSTQTGAPIVGLDVAAFSVETFQSFGVGTTDATGAYTISGLVPGRHVVFTLAERDGNFPYLDEVFDNIPCVNRNNCDFPEAIDGTFINVTPGGAVANVNFALDRLGLVSGTVTNAATGAPIQNVTVAAVMRLGTSVIELFVATTNASGAYTIPRLPAGAVYLYTFNTQGFVNEIYDDIACVGGCNPTTAVNSGTAVQVMAGGTTAARDFALNPGGRISGTITNAATGAPIQFVSVQAATRVNGSITIIGQGPLTNAAGEFMIGGLATGNYFLFTAGGSGVMNEVYNDIRCALNCHPILQSGEEVAVTAGQLTPGKNFAMEIGGAFEGTVTNQATGAPLQNVQVTVVTRIGNTNFQRSYTTNAQGRYLAAGLPAGTYWAYISSAPPGLVPEIFDNIPCLGACNINAAIATGAPIAVTVGPTIAAGNFALAQGGGITGTVRDSGTGSPITDDVEVQLYGLSGTARTFLISTGVNDSGTFTFSGLAAGTYYLATANTFMYRNEVYDGIPCVGYVCSSAAIGSATPIPVAVGSVVTGRDFSLDRSDILFGKVMSSTGQPLAGATVTLYQVGSGALFGSTTVDYRGGFGFTSLTNGQYVAFTSNTLGHRNEIYNDIPCATTCSPATALATGTPITISGAAAFSSPELVTGINFVLDPRTDAPAAPTNFRAVANGFTAQFTWTAPTPSTSGVATSYVIDAGVSPGGTVVSLPVPAGSGTSFSVPNVPIGTFYVRVRALNAGSSPPSNEATLVISGAGVSPPDPPTGLVAFLSGTGGSFLTFTWTAATTGGPATSYLLEAGSATGLANIATVPVAGRAFSFSGVPNGFYFLRVRAVNAGGVSAPSREVMIVVGGVPSPPPPPNFNSHSVSGNTVTLNWVAPSSGAPTSYIIEAGSATGLADLATVNTGNTNTTASFSGVPSGTYHVRLRAVNAQGASVVSNERTIVVP
jgi:5-hydroxyisourate hydrolase-like protein (transthyretin family)